MAFTIRLSSGVFGLPAGAESLDWSVVNDTDTDQEIRVTVFACPISAAKRATAPGPVQVSVPAKNTTHNANSVGPGQPFEPGMLHEVVVHTNDPKVLPTVEAWSDHGATVIPGTRIGPRDFIRLA